MIGRDRINLLRVVRAIAAVFGVINAVLGTLLVLRGHVSVFSFAVAVLCGLAVWADTFVIRRQRRLDRPRPDYSAIAAMEREVYGETFEHEGAPKPVRMVAGQTTMCKRCMTPYARIDELCTACYGERRRTARAGKFEEDRRAMRALAAASRAKAQTAGEHGYLPENLHRERESDRFRRRLEEGPRHPDTTGPATVDQYVAWLSGYIKRGGKPTHFYDHPFKGFRYAASGPLVVESDYEYGANSREIIVARGVETRRTNPAEAFGGWAHSSLYFMHGYRTNKMSFVPVYSDPEFDAFR